MKILVIVREPEHGRVDPEVLQQCSHHRNRPTKPGAVWWTTIDLGEDLGCNGTGVVPGGNEERVGTAGIAQNLGRRTFRAMYRDMSTDRVEYALG